MSNMAYFLYDIRCRINEECALNFKYMYVFLLVYVSTELPQFLELMCLHLKQNIVSRNLSL